jgi:putative colanic acid biosynthesis acetyltransferase WcaF
MPQALGRTGREDYTPRPMATAGSLKRLVMRLQLSGALPNQDYVLNHVVNRMPLVASRMRAYAALGVQFDDLDSANISLGVEMWAGHNLSVGARSTIGQRCYIDARGGIRVESDVSISREVCVLTAAHESDSPDFEAPLSPVRLGRRSWIATRAVVLPGVSIGEAAIVAAGAVVRSDVEPYTIVGGVPAKVLGKRREPMSYELDFRPSWY